MKSISFWIAAIVVIVLDQLSKHYISTTFAPGESRIVIPHVLWLTYVQNHTGAFGLFGSKTT